MMKRRVSFEQDWPREADEKYQRVCRLGHGGSGCVWMAKEKIKTHDNNESMSNTDGGQFVAIKRINIKSARTRAYAQREIAILSKLTHPNLIRLIHCFPYCPESETQSIVMSLAHGPNLFDLINEGGALGIHCARLVSRHLVAAASYLHVRAVTHRDIKPSNCVLVGADVCDPTIWSDDYDAARRVMDGAWKLVLVDFGFARAISLDDIYHHSDSMQSSSPHFRSLSLMQWRMSAVGSDMYVAPEVFEGMYEKQYETEAVAPFVSNYGLAADAYALGTTLLEIMTGVPPDEEIDDYIRFKKKVKRSSKMKQFLKFCGKKKMKKRYLTLEDLPNEALHLIQALTHNDPVKRTTIREAQVYPWIQGGAEESTYQIPQGDVSSNIGDEVIFL
mmetsp:Transcript_572/g.737  ORF Transcript_572/g.737 Transcript_572/m.737 type:complete len:389 (-) Transcript_572:110-1276(-)